jgi:8-oxo-dGTP pyrophosphatase MutT (NUDIX family)
MSYISFEKSVGCVVYRKSEDKTLFLLVQYRSWQWDFPKGHVEEGESEEQTLRREVLEETGIKDLEILPNFRESVHYFYTAKGNEKKERIAQKKGIYIFKNAVYYVAQTHQEDVVIDFENKAFVWLTYEEVCERLINSGSKKVMKEVFEALESDRRKKKN